MTSIPQALDWLAAAAPHLHLAQLRRSGKLIELLPEVDALYGVPQSAEYHPEIDTGVHIELTLEAASLLTDSPAVRFAALVHDLGKALTPPDRWPKHVDHESQGLVPVAAVCDRFSVPEDWRKLALMVCEYHLHAHRAFEMNPKSVVRLFRTTGLEDQPQLLEPFLLAVEADKRGRAGRLYSSYPQGRYLADAFGIVRSTPMPADVTTPQGQDVHNMRLHLIRQVRTRHQPTENEVF